jgi:CheY-like chemotaxis protein
MPKTLLLADDSVTIQKVVGISFASEDVAIVTVDNGDDAIARAKESKPDLILADVVMPGKNGYEVCEAVKADPELAHIPVLLLTGTFEAFDEERATRAGAAGHVSKPFEAQTLVEQAKRLLANSPGRSATPAPTPTPAAEPVATRETVSAPPAPSPAPNLESMTRGLEPGRSVDPAPPIEDAFDFFDDEMQELATPNASGGDDDLDIDSSDSAFAFGEDDLSPIAPRADPVAAPVRSAPPAGDRTVAILPEEPAAPAASASASDFDFDFESETPAPSVPSAAFLLDDSPASEARLIDEPLVPVEAADLAQATILDPNGASGFDVSSSDLGDPLAIGPSPGPHSDLESTGEPWSVSAPTAPHVDRIEPVDLSELPDLSEPVDSVHEDHTGLTAEPILSSPEPAGAPMRQPFAIDPTPFESTEPVDLPPTLAGPDELPPQIPEMAPEPLPEPPPLEIEPLAEPGFSRIDAVESLVEATAQPDSGTDPASAETLEAIAPKLRAQLHDTLEKIAWESFSDLTETIVRQAVERVEKVAWEVIPQLAETLVREEIRRMKGDDS